MNYFKIKKKLCGSYGDINVDGKFSLRKGDFLSIIGESGSGKTTVLRIIAGLEKSESEIIVDDEVWQNKKVFLPPQKREVGFVFQDYALFPNMNVIENLLYANKDLKLAENLLEIMNLKALKNRYPSTLSGGQKQRVALARALMRKPKLLLMDEPFSALDPLMRETLQKEILLLHKKFSLTTIMVSHSLEEVYKLSDKIIEIKNGKIVNHSKKALLKPNLELEGRVLDIKDNKVTVVVGGQIVEVESDVKGLRIGDKIAIFPKNLVIKKKV